MTRKDKMFAMVKRPEKPLFSDGILVLPQHTTDGEKDKNQ
jgi:hypothetical protein